MKHFVDRLPAALSLVTLVLFCSVTGLQAQTFVEIGTNSISSSDQGPIYRASASSTLDYSRFSYLYTAGELGIPAGSVIDSIQFYKDNAGAISNPGNAAFDMYLNNVSATSFSSSQIWSSVITGATQVVDRDYVVDFPYPQIPGNIRNSVGWMTMTDALGASYGFFYTGGSLQLSTSWDCFPVANDPTDDGFLWWQDGSVTDKTVGNTGTTLAPPALDPTGTYAGRRPVVRVYYTAPAPVPDDAGVSSIDAPAPIVAPGLHDLEVSITNYGTNPLTTVNAYYSLNGGPAVGPLLWPGANLPLAPGASDGPVALDLLNILAGPNQVKVWTDAPNAGTDGNNYNDTAYIEITGCPGALAPGSYTIGAAGDYPTITAAYAALLTCGISGPVTFTALPGSGPYNERVTMTAVPGASSVNTITFDGNGETWSWSTGTSADRAACTIDGAQWITITNWVFDVGLTNTYGWGIHLWHAANNNRILSNTFNHDLTSSSTGQAAVVASNSQTSAASSGDNANYTLVEGNTMNGGYYGVAIYGSSSLQNVGNVVRNNTILDPYYYGVYMLYQSNGLIERNEVTKPLRSSPFSTTNYGIYVSNGQNLRCDGNRIHDLATSASTTTPSTYGIYYLSSDATPAEPNLIQNNLVYNLSPSNGTSGTYYGLYLSGSDYTHLYHNTVVENVPTNSSTSSTAGVYITSTDADGNEVSSNIVYVNRGGNATTNVALYYAETDPLHYPVVSDYNALFNASTEANAGIGRLGSTTYTPLANWNASTTFDPNSIEEDPVPVSLALGDLTPTNGNLDDAADPAILVALDYNGVARPLNTDPDPGAIEFEPANFDAAITWVSPMGASTAGNQTITVNIENSASSVTNITSVNLTYTDGVTPVTEPFGSLSIVPGANQDLVFTTPYNLTAATQMRAWINTVNGSMDPIQGNDTTAYADLCIGVSGSFVIDAGGGGDFLNFQDAVNSLSCGLAGPVDFTVTPNSGPYTRFEIPEISGTSSTNTITFFCNGDTLRNEAAVSAERAGVLFMGADYVTIDSLVVDVDGGTYGHGIHFMNSSDHNTITKCTILVDSVSTSTTNFNGIVASNSTTSGTTTTGTNADFLTITDNIIVGGYYGIRLNNSSSTPGQSNVVQNNLVQDSYSYGIYLYGQEDALVKGNDVTRPYRTNNTSLNAIQLSTGCLGVVVDGNRIHNTDGGGESNICYALYNTADGTSLKPNTFQNNLIYDINEASSTIYGVYLSGSDFTNVYHNTILIDNPLSTGGASYGIYSTTTATSDLDFKNNIIVITRPGTTNRALWVASSSTTFSSDNNVLVVAGGSTNETAAFPTASTYATLADWQASNSNAYDQASSDADPGFTDPLNGLLEPTAGVINDIGDPAVVVPLDFNGNARPFGIAPDPGAIEFDPPALDANITWVAPVPPVPGGPQTVIVNIANDVASLSNITSVNLTYTDGITPVTEPFPGLLITPGTSQDLSFTLPFTISGSHNLRAWINTVNGGADGNQFNDTTAVIALCEALAGNYVIDAGGSGDFLTIAEFANTVTTCGVAAPVIADVLVGSGPYTEQVIFTPINGASAINTVTLKGNGETVLYAPTVSAERAAFVLDGVDYLKVDGFNIDVSTGSYGQGFQLINEADHDSITNNTITCPTNNTSSLFAGIIASGSLTSQTTAGKNANYTVVMGNTIRYAYYPIRFNGTSGSYDTSNVIMNNLLEDGYWYHVYFQYQHGGTISGNEITRPNHTAPSTFYGIYFTSGATGMLVDGNRIHNSNGGGDTDAAYGINFSSADATALHPNVVQNNVIYNLNSPASGTINGIINTGSDHAHYYHNTVSLDDVTGSTGLTRCFYQTTTADGIEVLNNIFSVSRDGTGTKQCIYWNTSTTTFTSDFNVLVMASTNGSTNNVAYFNSTDYVTLADYQLAGYETNSIDSDPAFVGSGDYTPTSGDLDDLCTGPVLAPFDFNGTARPLGTNPDPGATEFDPPTGDASITWVAPVNPVGAGLTTVIVNIANSVSSLSPVTTLNLTYTDGITPVTEPFTGLSIAPGANQDVSFTTQFNITGTHLLQAWINTVNGGPDDFQTNDTTVVEQVCIGIAGNFVIDAGGSGDYLTIQALVDDMVACGISGPVVGEVLAGSGPYVERVAIPEIVGASAVNTITIDGNGETLEHSPTVSAERAAVVFDGADHVIWTDFVIDVDGGTYGFGAHLLNQANYNTISNCTIINPEGTSSGNYAGITASSSLTGTTSTGDNANFCTIENNTLLGSSGSYKLRLNGASGTPALGNVVRNNELTNGYSYQIYMNYQQDALVQGNEISRATASTTTTYYALYMANCTNTVFDGNSVHDVASSTFYGMYVLGDATVGQENIFQNNVMYNVNNGTGSIYATYVSGADYVKFLHNTIIADDQTSSSGLVYGLYSTSTTVTGLEMKNNIVYISRAGSGTKRCLYVAGSSSSFTSDHNVLTMASTDGSTNEVAYFSTGYTTLADWQASNGNAYDQNSLDDDPLFYGPLNPTPSAAAVQDAGDPLVVVPFDFYGTARPQGAGPDPGAIEFELPDCPFPFGVSLAAGTDEISVSWTSGAGNTSYTIEYGLDGFTQGSGTFLTDLLPAAMPVNITGLAQGTPYDVYLYESCTGGDSPTFGPYSITTAIPVLVVGSYCQDFDSWDLCNSPTTGCGQNCPLPDQWKNISGDDSDWSVEAGATTSTTTGPAVDNTLGTTAGQYLYTESSTCYGATRILQSPVFDLSNFTNDPRVSFAYHMYGADMGTLTIQYEEPFGSGNWVNVWSRTGQQQTSASAPWELDTVGLAVTGNFTRIRVVGVTGSNFNSDMAVDDICILEGPCQYPVMSLLSVDCNSVDTTYSVEVDVVDLGSALSVDIDSTTTNGTGTNVAGITATGPVVTGPFGNLNDVTLTIEDPAILGCEFSINVIGPDCTPPPANDTCAYVDPSLTVIGVGSNVTRNGTTTGATDDQNLIQSGYFGSQYEGYVWESFTTTECLDLVIDLCGTSPVYGIGQTGLFAGCGGPILIRTASDFGLCDGNYTAFWNSLPAGTYYYPILHDAEGSNTGPYTWRVRGFAPVTACATNTTVCAATPMTCNSQVTGSTTFLPSTLPANACPFIDVPSSGGSLWYSFTPTVDQNVILSTCAVGTTFDTRLSVFTGPDCNTLDCYTLGDDVGGACGLGTQIEFFAQNGQTYWIAVHSPGPSSHGNFELSLACNTVCPRPPNDVCSTAEGVTSFLLDGTGTFTTGDNSCAMNDAMTTCVPYLNNQGMWYSFNSGDNTIHFLDLHTNNEDGALTSTTMNYVLYSGGCDGDLQAVGEEACVVDGSGDDILLPSLTPSTNYLLRLSNVGDVGIEGTFSLRVQHPGLYDAGITAVNAPSAGLLCTSTISAEVELTNFGETTLTSVDILYDMSGLNPQVYTWTGSLAFGASEIVVLPDFVSPYGIQTFNVATSNPNGQVDRIPGNDALAVPGVDVTGETVVLEITSDNDPSGLFWEIYDQSFNLLAFSDGTGAPNGPAGGYLPNATQSVTLCLSTINGPNFVFLLSDFLGDGLSGTGNGDGSWRLIAENGGTLIGSDFDGTIDGFSVPTFAPQTPSVYTFGQPFNLPPGPAFIEPDECDVFTNSLLNKVYCHAVSGISSYQFEFSRPDAGFVRRIAVPRNWVRFSEMQTSPLLPGLKYFARVRVDDGSGFPNNNWSTGCEMGLDPNQVPGCTGLYDQPGAPAHSCDVIKTFGGSDKIFATPVVTATQYRFRFEGVTAGTVPLRTIARPSYACLLNWFTLPLTDGVYNVSVEALVGGQWSGYCGPVCPVTIVSTPSAFAGRDLEVVSTSAMQVWPNPVRDGQVRLLIEGLTDETQRVSVEVFDLFGKRVMATQQDNSGEVFNTVLELDGFATGIYVINVTVNEQVYLQRISVL